MGVSSVESDRPISGVSGEKSLSAARSWKPPPTMPKSLGSFFVLSTGGMPMSLERSPGNDGGGTGALPPFDALPPPRRFES